MTPGRRCPWLPAVPGDSLRDRNTGAPTASTREGVLTASHIPRDKFLLVLFPTHNGTSGRTLGLLGNESVSGRRVPCGPTRLCWGSATAGAAWGGAGALAVRRPPRAPLEAGVPHGPTQPLADTCPRRGGSRRAEMRRVSPLGHSWSPQETGTPGLGFPFPTFYCGKMHVTQNLPMNLAVMCSAVPGQRPGRVNGSSTPSHSQREPFSKA